MASQINCCPFCRGEIAGTYKWNFEARVLISGAAVVRFTKKEARIFNALWLAAERGAGVAHTTLMESLYFDDPQGGPDSENVVSVFLCKMRKTLRGTGIEISGGKGNRLRQLTFAKPKAEAA